MVTSSQPMLKLIGRTHISDMSCTLHNIFSLGIFYIITKLSPYLSIVLKTSPSTLSEADCVILEDQYGNSQLIKVKKIATKHTLVLTRYIKDNHVTILETCYGRFIYDYKLDKFVTPSVDFSGAKKNFDEMYQACMMRSREDEKVMNYEKQIIYGKNSLGIYLLKD